MWFERLIYGPRVDLVPDLVPLPHRTTFIQPLLLPQLPWCGPSYPRCYCIGWCSLPDRFFLADGGKVPPALVTVSPTQTPRSPLPDRQLIRSPLLLNYHITFGWIVGLPALPQPHRLGSAGWILQFPIYFTIVGWLDDLCPTQFTPPHYLLYFGPHHGSGSPLRTYTHTHTTYRFTLYHHPVTFGWTTPDDPVTPHAPHVWLVDLPHHTPRLPYCLCRTD